jgi:hypothetical protein
MKENNKQLIIKRIKEVIILMMKISLFTRINILINKKMVNKDANIIKKCAQVVSK